MTENNTNPNVLPLRSFKKWNFFQCDLKCCSGAAWYTELLPFFKAVIFLYKFGLLYRPLVPQNASAVWGTEPLLCSAQEGIGLQLESHTWEAQRGLADEWL